MRIDTFIVVMAFEAVAIAAATTAELRPRAVTDEFVATIETLEIATYLDDEIASAAAEPFVLAKMWLFVAARWMFETDIVLMDD